MMKTYQTLEKNRGLLEEGIEELKNDILRKVAVRMW
jgi:hypothetical protein